MGEALSGWHAKAWLLHLKCTQGLKGALTLNVARETCGYLTDLLVIPYTNWDGSVLFAVSPVDMHQRKCVDARVMKGCLCIINSAEVFYLAQGTSKKGAANKPCRMHLDSFRRSALTLMHEARSFPGVAYRKGQVYVFAGKTTTCEQLSLKSLKWSRMHSLSVKLKRISTCSNGDKIYLMAEKQHKLHIYDTVIGGFETVETNIDFIVDFGVCVIGSDLVKVNESEAWKWRLSAGNPVSDCTSGSLLGLFSNWKIGGSKTKAPLYWSGPIAWEGKTYIFTGRNHPYWGGLGEMESVAVFEAATREIEIKPILA